MKIRIGIPDNKIYKPLFANTEKVKEQYEVEYFSAHETIISDLFLNNRLDIAALTPLGYAAGTKLADYRILPADVMGAYGFTNLLSFIFREGLKDIKQCAIPKEKDFLIEIGKILLKEKYSIFPEFVRADINEPDILLSQFPTALIYNSSKSSYYSIDITEEWLDSYQLPLPLLFWVVRNEEEPANAKNIINDLSGKPNLVTEPIIAIDSSELSENRNGKYIWKWDKEFDDALHFTFELLYMQKLIDVIPAIKTIDRY